MLRRYWARLLSSFVLGVNNTPKQKEENSLSHGKLHQRNGTRPNYVRIRINEIKNYLWDQVRQEVKCIITQKPVQKKGYS